MKPFARPAPAPRHLAVLLPLGLAACGGGGDGGTASFSTGIALLDQFFVESFDAFESAAFALVDGNPRYRLQATSWYVDLNANSQFDPATETLRNTYPLLSSGVHYAHAAGLTGAGAILSIVDDGFRQDHEAFAGKSITAQAGLATLDHGTIVASVAAGNSPAMIGMAPGADLAFGSYDSLSTLTAATLQARTLGAVAQNNSWGFVNTPVGASSYSAVFGSGSGQDYLAALRSYAANGVVIFAAENAAAGTTAGLMPALPALEPGLEPGWLAVINGEADLVGDDIVAARRLSGGCLEAAAWCLAAEGSWTGATATSTTSYDFATGTSFAAPMVAGAMAILAEAFPTLTPHDLRIRLLASADNSFAGFTATGTVELVPGYSRAISEEWGHGFLDVQAALLPIGRTTAAMGDGSTYDLAEPLAVEGLATGDAVARALSGVPLAVDDALAARFEVAADSLVARRAPTALGRDLRARWESGRPRGCCGAESWFPGTRTVSARRDGLTIDLALPSDGTATGAGVMIGQDFASLLGDVTLRLGVGRDGGALLPQWQGDAGSPLAAAELALAAPFGSGASLELAAGFGAGDGTALTAASAALVTRGVFGAGDRLALTVGLPVAVADGSSTVTLPVATMSGAAQQTAIAVDLAPEDREMRVGVEYQIPVAAGTSAFVALAHAENHGNVAGVRDTGVFAGLRARF